MRGKVRSPRAIPFGVRRRTGGVIGLHDHYVVIADFSRGTPRTGRAGHACGSCTEAALAALPCPGNGYNQKRFSANVWQTAVDSHA